eukprot:TRINITY_DN24939_c0_g4_i1.p1 TRINITY_DN24939_c0_g4~~TRINITY_DN24939_c0_g4_i1.p1  ORF type:complete len:2093 (-),score=241.50 TRINITY_DN24939_c0_g4_i1:36-6314(-)
MNFQVTEEMIEWQWVPVTRWMIRTASSEDADVLVHAKAETGGALINVKVTSTENASCDTKSFAVHYIAGPWSKIRYKQLFSGTASCWSIFGDDTQLPQGVSSGLHAMFPTDGDEFRSNGVDPITSNCVETSQQPDNFWSGLPNTTTGRTKQESSAAEAVVVLRRVDFEKGAGVATAVSCAHENVEWTIDDIDVLMQVDEQAWTQVTPQMIHRSETLRMQSFVSTDQETGGVVIEDVQAANLTHEQEKPVWIWQTVTPAMVGARKARRVRTVTRTNETTGGAVIHDTVTYGSNVDCESRAFTVHYISGHWKQLRYRQKFAGQTVCWSTFGDDSQLPFGVSSGLSPLSVRDGDEIRTLNKDPISFRTSACAARDLGNLSKTLQDIDNWWFEQDSTSNFDVSVVLRRADFGKTAGIVTAVSCPNNASWTISDIEVLMEVAGQEEIDESVTVKDPEESSGSSDMMEAAHFIAGRWSRVRFTQRFKGTAGCWYAFGFQRHRQRVPNGNLVPVKMDVGDEAFDVIGWNLDRFPGRFEPSCCDKSHNNFWHNRTSEDPTVTMVLRRQFGQREAGLYTGVRSPASAGWVYSNIAVQMEEELVPFALCRVYVVRFTTSSNDSLQLAEVTFYYKEKPVSTALAKLKPCPEPADGNKLTNCLLPQRQFIVEFPVQTAVDAYSIVGSLRGNGQVAWELRCDNDNGLLHLLDLKVGYSLSTESPISLRPLPLAYFRDDFLEGCMLKHNAACQDQPVKKWFRSLGESDDPQKCLDRALKLNSSCRSGTEGRWLPEATAQNLSRSRVCQSSNDFCTHAGEKYEMVDCDEDGVADHFCSDAKGRVGFLGSAQTCKEDWPTGLCKLPAFPNFISDDVFRDAFVDAAWLDRGSHSCVPQKTRDMALQTADVGAVWPDTSANEGAWLRKENEKLNVAAKGHGVVCEQGVYCRFDGSHSYMSIDKTFLDRRLPVTDLLVEVRFRMSKDMGPDVAVSQASQNEFETKSLRALLDFNGRDLFGIYLASDTGRVHVITRGSDGIQDKLQSSKTCRDNQWHTAKFTFTMAGATTRLELFVDDVREHVLVGRHPGGILSSNPSTMVSVGYIGGRYEWMHSGTRKVLYPFAGDIAAVNMRSVQARPARLHTRKDPFVCASYGEMCKCAGGVVHLGVKFLRERSSRKEVTAYDEMMQSDHVSRRLESTTSAINCDWRWIGRKLPQQDNDSFQCWCDPESTLIARPWLELFGKMARQSATSAESLGVAVPQMAVDSNFETCSAVSAAQGPWWEVNLGGTYVIQKVFVARASIDTSSVSVQVDGKNCGQRSLKSKSAEIECDATGTILKIQARDASSMQLCEVKALAVRLVTCETFLCPRHMVSRSKPIVCPRNICDSMLCCLVEEKLQTEFRGYSYGKLGGLANHSVRCPNGNWTIQQWRLVHDRSRLVGNTSLVSFAYTCGLVRGGLGTCQNISSSAPVSSNGSCLAIADVEMECPKETAMTRWSYKPKVFVYECCRVLSELKSCRSRTTFESYDYEGSSAAWAKHDLRCAAGEVMTQWVLRRPSRDRIIFSYACCDSQGDDSSTAGSTFSWQPHSSLNHSAEEATNVTVKAPYNMTTNLDVMGFCDVDFDARLSSYPAGILQVCRFGNWYDVCGYEFIKNIDFLKRHCVGRGYTGASIQSRTLLVADAYFVGECAKNETLSTCSGRTGGCIRYTTSCAQCARGLQAGIGVECVHMSPTPSPTQEPTFAVPRSPPHDAELTIAASTATQETGSFRTSLGGSKICNLNHALRQWQFLGPAGNDIGVDVASTCIFAREGLHSCRKLMTSPKIDQRDETVLANFLAFSWHYLSCGDGEAMTRWRYIRTKSNTSFSSHFEYTCCKVGSGLGKCHRRVTDERDDAGGTLDAWGGHGMECHDDQLLTQWVLRRPSEGLMKFSFTCCDQRPNKIADVVKATHARSPVKNPLKCGPNKALRQWRILRNSTGAIRFQYTCADLQFGLGLCLDKTTSLTCLDWGNCKAPIDQQLSCASNHSLTHFAATVITPISLKIAYTCCHVLAGFVSCLTKDTDPQLYDPGSIGSWARHNVRCGVGLVMTRWLPKNTKDYLQFEYTCCEPGNGNSR